ncbi:MAG: hypothetical protein BWY46_01555 [Firmicutes bacterium ADurb.Bin300]|nr:MAG: hypothetical protein BWY46_01555 [Firmicutes bacterium ADurb.Bin300]
MTGLSDYIDKTLAGIKNNDALYRYKGKLLGEMSARADELQMRGLSDKKVILDLIEQEYPNLAEDFLQRQKKQKSGKSALLKGLSLITGFLLYTFVLTLVYLAFSFITEAWALSWLIMVNGIILFLVVYFLKLLGSTAGKHRYKTARACLIAAIMLCAVFVFLISQVLLTVNKSYLIFLAAVAIAIICDVILAYSTNQKFAIFNLLIALPSSAALIYIILSLLELISWHPYWLIILNAFLADFIIIILAISRNSKNSEKEEADDLWKEN